MTSQPTLLLDKETCQHNIAEMAKKARLNNLRFKPHMKTHQSAQIGEWIRDHGAKAITVSSVKMAKYFAEHNWNDITIAMPVNPKQVSAINELADSRTITLLINSPQVAEAVNKKLSQNVQVYIEFDSGAHRTGLSVDQTVTIDNLIQSIKSCPNLHWKGFYSHPGHSYGARSKSQIKEIHQQVTKLCKTLKDNFEPANRSIEVCIGDTPCCSAGTDFDSVDAISPGNFVFYDLMQWQIGSCNISDIAVAMQCPAIDKYPDSSELIIHGGAIHFSKELLLDKDLSHYGMLVQRDKESSHWKITEPKSYLKKLSQEHGVLHSQQVKQYKIGDNITILPIHSCLTAHLMGRLYLDTDTDQYIEQMKAC